MSGSSRPDVTGGALRQRRYRAHRRGDHSLCLPASCARAGEAPSALGDELGAPELGPDEWGPSGAQLWRDLLAGTPAGHRPLLREMCRIVDRLDRMDGILAGRRDWVRISTLDFGENVKVRITLDGVLAEARQQAATLLAGLRELAAVSTTGKAGAAPKAGGLSALADELAARRRAPTG